MKTLIFLLLFSFGLTNAQDKEPTPWKFEWGYSSTPRPFVIDSFPQTSILTGGQWSGSTRMNNALKNNATTAGRYHKPNATVETPTNLIIQPKWLDAGYYNPGYFGAVMMQYEPTLPLTTTNFGKILRPLDDSDPIFGFLNRRGRILTDDTDANYSRIILEKDSTYVDGKVLSGIYPVPTFQSNQKPGQTDSYNGKLWYLTINLKRLYPAVETTKDNAVILSLKIPFTKWNNSTGFIKFNKLPVNSSTANFNMNYFESRGYAQEMASVSPAIDSISITRNMLPISTDGYESITISGEFFTNNFPQVYNPEFSAVNEPIEIKSFDIEVKYFGHTDVAIDYVRIENALAHHLVRGKFDSLGVNPDTNLDYTDRRGITFIKLDPSSPNDSVPVNTIKDIIQTSIDSLKAKSTNWRDAKLFRLYFQDIENPSFYWWGALRYANKFANGMFIVSDVENYPELYEYYTNAPNRYLGMKFNGTEQHTAQPFFRAPYQHGFYTDSSYNLLGYKYGFSGAQLFDTLTSGYETFFSDSSRKFDPLVYTNVKTYQDTVYDFHIGNSNSVQTEWELVIKNKFNNPIHSRYLYLNSPWFVNLFIGTNYSLRDWKKLIPLSNPENKYVVAQDVSSKTAEIIRLLMNTSILMGAKGIFYDREESKALYYLNEDNERVFHSSIGLGDGDKPVIYNPNDKYGFIEDNALGGDFAGGSSDIYDIGDYIVADSIAKYANITPDRIYIGTKSIRLEVKKIVDWIRLNDKELIDLRLQAIFSKGFKTFESWNPYKFSRWNSSPLRQLVNLEGIRTRKLFEPKHTMIHNTNPDYEYIDSSFFDITLLQHKNNTDTDIQKNKNAVYLGVINRRTDPLIFRDSIDAITQDSLRELMFFTAAEFDDKVRFGGTDLWGVNQDSTWWQNQWWKRLGAREIKIPLNIEPYGNGTYILAQEIGIDSLDKLGWRYDEKYYHRVDTTLTYKDSVMTKLLPAQGKIIKLEFVPYFFNDPTKDSDATNDHCYFCDIYNDFEAFKFQVVETPTEEGCCYTIKFIYNGDCIFEDIPFRLIFEGESGNTFVDSNPMSILKDSIGTNIKYKDILMDLNSLQGEVILGTFCVTESSNKYKISLLAGKDKDDKFIGCDREMQFEVVCDGSDDPPKDCCEGLSVSETMYSTGTSPLDPTMGSYCTKYKIDTDFDSDCIFGIKLEGGGVQRPLIPIGSVPLDFTFGTGIEFDVCYEMAQCGSESEQSQSIRMVKMQFLGKNGTIVCEIDVPILIPCTFFGLSDFTIDFTSPYIPKSSYEKPDSKTYESESFKVTVWPNPTSGELNVEIFSKVDTEVDINFISNIGANITNENGVTINKGVNEKTYNLKNYSSGVYYLQINGKDGNIVLPIMLNK